VRIIEERIASESYCVDPRIQDFLNGNGYIFLRVEGTQVERYFPASQFGKASTLVHFYPGLYPESGPLILSTSQGCVNEVAKIFLESLYGDNGYKNEALNDLETKRFHKPSKDDLKNLRSAIGAVTSCNNPIEETVPVALLRKDEKIARYLVLSRVVLEDSDDKIPRRLDAPQNTGQEHKAVFTLPTIIKQQLVGV
jgi:hypothetical protein